LLTAQDIINRLNLEPLPLEGGMFRSTYRSPLMIGEKHAGTAIYYLLTENSYSHMHRLCTDEVFHFYLGDPIELLELFPDGTSRKVILGQDIMNGQEVQAVVNAGSWQGSRVIPGGRFALIGTTMSPGYAQSDYEHGRAEDLIALYPDRKDMIEKLCGETIYR
jgi:predicted cupin superfamily sugar epimerase